MPITLTKPYIGLAHPYSSGNFTHRKDHEPTLSQSLIFHWLTSQVDDETVREDDKLVNSHERLGLKTTQDNKTRTTGYSKRAILVASVNCLAPLYKELTPSQTAILIT